MNRSYIFNLSAITALGLAAMPGIASAQQKALKEQLAGVWILVSTEGTTTDRVGTKPKGVAIYDASGNYSITYTNPDRPMWKSRDRNLASQEEIKSAIMGTTAQAGTWKVDADGKTLVRHVDTSLVPNNEGQDFKYTLAISGDELTLTDTVAPAGGVAGGVGRQVFKRAK